MTEEKYSKRIKLLSLAGVVFIATDGDTEDIVESEEATRSVYIVFDAYTDASFRIVLFDCGDKCHRSGRMKAQQSQRTTTTVAVANEEQRENM